MAESWDDVVAAAKEEGQLLLYSTRADADNAELLEAFMRRYPEITARSVRLVGGAMIARVEQELAAGALAADVLLHAEQQWAAERIAEGSLLKANGPASVLWEGSARPIDDGVVTVTAEPWVIGYNTELVETPPIDWDSLLEDSRFTNQVGLNDTTGLTVAIWYEFVEQRFPGYWETFSQLRPQIYPNSAPLTAGLSSGEIAWSPYSLVSTIRPLQDNGAPIDWVVPEGGTWALERHAMIHMEAPNPNAARLFVDYMMSQEGQSVINSNQRGFSFAPGVTVESALDVDLNKIARIDYTSFDPDLLRNWQARMNELFR